MLCSGFSVTSTSTETNASGGTYRYAAWKTPSPGALGIDIVDSSGCSVANPIISMSATTSSFDCATTIGTIGASSQKLRLTNTTGNPNWSLTIAATSGENTVWSNGSANYDFNDSSGSPPGCGDGADADSGEAGQLTLDPSSATATPKSGCTTTGVSLGSAAAFAQGTLNSLTLATASSANTSCYWDFTSIGASQKIPKETPTGTYTLNLTVTVTAN
jgi:hypothetical protein